MLGRSRASWSVWILGSAGLAVVAHETVDEWKWRVTQSGGRSAWPRDVCRCRSWEGSPLLRVVREAWQTPWDLASESGHRPGLAMLGEDPEARMHFCSVLITDMGSPEREPVGTRAFALRRLGRHAGVNVSYTSFCAPVMSAVAALCFIELGFDAVQRIKDNDTNAHHFVVWADVSMSFAAMLGFWCHRRAAPLAQFSRAELRWNYVNWIARFRNSWVVAPTWDRLRPQHVQALESSSCPKDRLEPLPRADVATVECLVPFAWPEEQGLAAEIADTWASECDTCTFFVAARPGVPPPPGWIGPCSVVDLAGSDDRLVDDPKSYQANGAKLQAVFFHGLRHRSLDWVCFADADVFFAVPNFRRLVVRHGLEAGGSHWLGPTFTTMPWMDGMQVEPFGGSCVSRGASEHFTATFPGFSAMPEQPFWPPSIWPCAKVPIPHRTGVTMSTATTCLGSVGIFAEDPEMTHDARGRSLYLVFHALQAGLLDDPSARPPRVPFLTSDSDLHNDTRLLWRGKEYIHSSCKNRRWVGYYPVMFHGHVTHDPEYFEAFRGTAKEDKKRRMKNLPSQREVYMVLSQNEWYLPDDLPKAFQRVFRMTRPDTE